MLTISQAQIDLLDKNAEQNFIEQVAIDLRKNQVAVSPKLSHDELLNRVKAAVNCAKSFELSSKYSLAMFTEISFIVGPQFYKYPLIGNLLQNENIQADHRVKVILGEMDDDHWQNVKQVATEGDWQVFCEEFTKDA